MYIECFRRRIDTVVGAPIPVEKTPEPTQEQIDKLDETYVTALIELFETNKAVNGIPPEQKLVVV